MVNPNPSFLSKRVRKRSQTGITSDRYQYLGLDQAEPDLGDPLVGVSSVGANPYTGNISDLYVISSSGSGKRYWTKQTSLISGGVVTPGSITVRNKGTIVGGANQITDVNFVGTGVTVVNPATWVGAGSSSVDVQITVTDVAVTGNTGAVPYKASTGYLVGANDFVYSSTNQNVGIGSTIPTTKLDITGNIRVSGTATVGVLTASTGFFTSSLTVGNFKISDNTTFVSIASSSVGIGTTFPTVTLDVRGNSYISGIATIGIISVTNGTIGVLTATSINSGFITSTNGFVGVLTSTTINATSGIITNITGTSGTFTNLNVTNILQVDTNTLYVTSTTRNVGFGTTNPLQKVQVGSASSAVVITNNARVGIATTNPQYNLDVNGDISFGGKLYVGGASGTSGQVLISGGTGNPSWGAPGSVTVGSANSVGVADNQTNGLYYPTFTQQTQNNALINVDVSGLAFNPGLNYFGIGTTNLNYTLTVNGTVGVNTNALYVSSTTNNVGIGTTNPVATLDVNGTIKSSTTVSAGTSFIIGTSPVANLSSGIVTTTTATSTVLSSVNTGIFRSARYNVQVTCTGQLVSYASSASSVSVSSIQGGTNYVSGNYTNIGLTTVSGTGNDARANISIIPEQTITITSISNGAFLTSNDLSAVKINAPVVFNRSIPATAAQNSKVTSINIANPGSGYTSIPTIGIATPTNNPAISGVTGIGSTATAVVSAMLVSNVVINSAGIHTTIPTVAFNTPVGGGSTATGIVGVGVSTIVITNPGSGYNPLPTVSIGGGGSPIGIATVAISSVSVSNVYINNTGIGYTSGNFPILTFSAPDVGINTATAIVSSLGISTQFTITPGIGYTRPPILTVGAPDIGINTATLSSTLGVTTFTVVTSGTGYTSSPTLIITPTVTGFGATVGLGITSDGIILSGGSGYGGLPTVTFSAPDVGSNAAVGNWTQIVGGGALSNFVITNPGSGYFKLPTVSVSGGAGSGAGVTITQMKVTDIVISNSGYGVTVVPTASIISTVGSGASVTARMGIGRVDVVGFGSGYNLPPGIAVTAIDGITGSGASVVAGLGVTSTNISITNPGTGYSSIPTITISSPVGVASTASGISGVSINAINVINPGIGYSSTIPTVNFNVNPLNQGSGVGAAVSTIVVTNVYIVSTGSGYTATDLATSGIATFNPVGTSATVGFGVSTVTLTNLGIGYTTAASAVITFSTPNLGVGPGIGSVATATATLGYPGILPGPGVTTTGSTSIYYVSSKTANSLGISTGVGIGTFTSTTVGDADLSSNSPSISIGGTITNVLIVSPGSGYTSGSQITALNFDGANVGSGFTFTSSTVVNNYQFSDVMILQSIGSASTSCDYLEFGTIANDGILGAFNADISGSNARLLFTPTYRNNTIKISSHSITI